MGLQRNTAKTGKAPSKNRKGHAPLLLQATIHIRVCKNTVSDTRVSDMPRPGCRTCQDPGVGHIPYANPVNSLRKGKAFLLKEAKTSGQIPAKDKRQNKKQTK